MLVIKALLLLKFDCCYRSVFHIESFSCDIRQGLLWNGTMYEIPLFIHCTYFSERHSPDFSAVETVFSSINFRRINYVRHRVSSSKTVRDPLSIFVLDVIIFRTRHWAAALAQKPKALTYFTGWARLQFHHTYRIR